MKIIQKTSQIVLVLLGLFILGSFGAYENFSISLCELIIRLCICGVLSIVNLCVLAIFESRR